MICRWCPVTDCQLQVNLHLAVNALNIKVPILRSLILLLLLRGLLGMEIRNIEKLSML